MAKNYADKKYNEDFKVEEIYDNGLSIILELIRVQVGLQAKNYMNVECFL